MAVIALVCVSALNSGFDGDLAKYAIGGITIIALGADAVTEWLESRKQSQTT
jgi:hypothetical protein